MEFNGVYLDINPRPPISPNRTYMERCTTMELYNKPEAPADQENPELGSTLFGSLGKFFTVISNQAQRFTDRFSAKSPNDELDCTIRENALKVLGLSEEEAQNRSVLDERYKELCKEWGARITKAATSQPLSERFKLLLNRTEEAYRTLVTQDSSSHHLDSVYGDNDEFSK